MVGFDASPASRYTPDYTTNRANRSEFCSGGTCCSPLVGNWEVIWLARHLSITEWLLRPFRDQPSDRVRAADGEGLAEHLC
jgi:hypothetical protein